LPGWEVRPSRSRPCHRDGKSPRKARQADSDTTVRPRGLVHAFILSECEEAAVRRALADAAPLYWDAPEAIEAVDTIADLFGVAADLAVLRRAEVGTATMDELAEAD
jgi:hypothetical protein